MRQVSQNKIDKLVIHVISRQHSKHAMIFHYYLLTQNQTIIHKKYEVFLQYSLCLWLYKYLRIIKTRKYSRKNATT